MKLKEAVKNNKFGKYLYLLWRYKNYDEFKVWVESCNLKNCYLVNELGALNDDQYIYYMKYPGKEFGFFAYWNYSIRGIDYAISHNMVPVMDWTSNSPYYEPQHFGEESNPFEYYFKNISGIEIRDVSSSAKVVRMRLGVDLTDDFKDCHGYRMEEIPIDKYVSYTQKYFQIQHSLNEEIMNSIKELLKGKKTLAVHIRGVEWGKVKNHPIPLKLEEYMEKIDAAMEEYGFEQIFLATDSEETITKCTERYGSKLVYYQDALRTKAGSHELVILDNTINREMHHYRMGVEVLKDMLTLSKCEGLIAGLSMVSFAARIFKLSRNEDYIYYELLEQKVAAVGKRADQLIKN
jgi:hypothetical protein